MPAASSRRARAPLRGPGRLLLAAALLAGGAGCAGDAGPGPEAPNVVLICVDTLRADAFSATGGPAPTPAFDALLAAGVHFEHAYAPTAETAPSHATLFTGQEPARHGVVRNGAPLAAEAETLAVALQRAGWRTGGFVSSWVLDARFGWPRGFDHYDSQFPEGVGTVTRAQRYPGAIWDESFEGALDRRAEHTAARALAWLDGLDGERPWFLFLHFFDPHGPYAPPAPFAERALALDLDTSDRRTPPIPADALAHLIRLYWGDVMYLDHVVGELVEGLAERGHGRETLTVVTADHGEGLGQHDWLEHIVHLYEELVRVPLVFSWPGHLPGGVALETPVALADVAPTLLELVGVPAAAAFDGRSLAGALRAGSEPEGRPVFATRRELEHPPRPEHRPERHAVRTARWKYIETPGVGHELYDLSRDPGELRDQAALQPDVAAGLSRTLASHLQRLPVPAPSPEIPESERRLLEALGYTE